MSTDAGRLSLRVIVLLIACSAPLALAIETLFRVHVLGRVLGPALDELRSYFSPTTTRVAWVLVGVTIVAGLVGLLVTRAAVRKLAHEPDPSRRMRGLMDRTLLLTSIPQVPAVLATFCFTAGAELLPVLVSMAISTGFVLAQGFVGERELEQAMARPAL